MFISRNSNEAMAKKIRKVPQTHLISASLGDPAAQAGGHLFGGGRRAYLLRQRLQLRDMLSFRIPSPTKTAVERGSPPSSPQTLMGLPASEKAATASWIRRKTAGWKLWQQGATSGFVRSAARRYWLKSLVPMLAKSARAASAPAIRAAEGTSIIAPRGRPSRKETRSRRSSSSTSSTTDLAAMKSSTPPTIGNMI